MESLAEQDDSVRMENIVDDEDRESEHSDHSATSHHNVVVGGGNSAAEENIAAESDMDLDLLAESESDSESETHSNHGDTQSIQRSAVTGATAGSDAGEEEVDFR